MAREPIPTWYFVLVVVRLGHRFLAVREAKHGQLWYLPAGRIEPGESILQAAVRETLEETGVPIAVEGLLRLEHTPSDYGAARVRVIVVARPADDTPPKCQPDDDSLEAAWLTLEEIEELPLRGEEVLRIFRHIAQGGAVFPLGLVTTEGAPYS
jgi:8-oxo-dGTP pyrophosphatase MutT (NUDIX family)